MSDSPFSYTSQSLADLAGQALDLARRDGASAAEVEVSEGSGLSVSVRQGALETIEHNRDKGIGVTVYLGRRRGHASTSDFSADALARVVDKALSIARYTAEDDCAGLADEALLATSVPDLDLYHPWDIDVDQAGALARDCEAAALAVDARIRNSEGGSLSSQNSQFVYANSLGFSGGYPSSRQSLSCAVIAEEDGAMQRDYWYTTARAAGDLDDVAVVGRRAGERALRRLRGRRLSTRQCPVLFEAPVASGLLASFVSAISGGHLYRKSSFLLDSLGQQIFPGFVRIQEQPFLPRGLASSPFDAEGVATHERDVVRDGVVQGYFLSSYSARKLGLRSTGNAGGNHNLIVSTTGEDFDALLRKMGTGLLVTELLGHGLNMVTGDYSRGAAGFWVENGQIAHAVEEITIAGNLRDMLRDIVALGTDVETRGSRRVGSILIGRMTVAGE
ncbi:MAG TPA: metalloprotease PmbA [Thiobacillaceae bacterium]|nr:metalloprotease PmbA [Thiobacillaceae bacterium]HNU65213.1 metalloprotease PmbA [Thiobacillaceae bacterium]